MAKTKNPPAPRTPRLGRGLSSLMIAPVAVAPPAPPPAPAREVSQSPLPSPEAAKRDSQQADGERITFLPLTAIQPNSRQPRQQFGEAALNRLADSIRNEGVMQPVIVRPRSGDSDNGYELVAGERRWRAAGLAGLDVVPAIVRELNDQQLAAWALIENLQREDLNPIERANAFQGLIDQFALSHDQIAKRVGIERSTVSNSLRLLNLCEGVQDLVRGGALNGGQARALAGLIDHGQQINLAKRAVREAMSVRKVEEAVRRISDNTGQPQEKATQSQSVTARQAHLADLANQISRQIGTKTAIRPGRKKGAGSITIQFHSLEQFDQLLERLGIETE